MLGTTLSSSLGTAAVRELVTKTVAAISVGGTNPITTATATARPLSLADPIVFKLEIADGTRDTLLRFAKEIFDASAATCLGARVDVVPLFPLPQVGASAPSFGPFTKDSMVKEKGFSPQFSYVAMGGTFDHLHGGHKLLLLTSASFATKRLRIGVTSAELLAKKKYAEALQPFEARKAEVIRYMTSVRSDLELEVEEISDMAGGTDKIPGVEALVVSPETLPALAKVNEMRHTNGLKPMELVQIPYIGGDDEASRVSSTKLRQMQVQASTTAQHQHERE